MRSHQTEARERLEYHLRAHRILGLKRKRHKRIGLYMADLICRLFRLIVEMDGGRHAEQTQFDRERYSCLREQGYGVLRVWNQEQ